MQNPPSLLSLLAELAYEQYEKGVISHDQLVIALQKCINLAAIENGSSEMNVPFPEVEYK